jgi:hypothetical protein
MENLFDSEVHQKKGWIKNLRHKTNGRRSSKAMFSFDYMTPEDRREYMKAGEIKMSNIYDKILSKEEFEQLPDERKKAALTHWRIKFTNKDIKDAMDWNDYHLYKSFDKYGVAYEKRSRNNKGKKKEPKNKETKSPSIQSKESEYSLKTLNDFHQEEILKAAQDLQKMQQNSGVTVLPANNSGTTFSIDDEIYAQDAVNKLMKFASFLEDEDHKVKIRLEISEVKDEEKLKF